MTTVVDGGVLNRMHSLPVKRDILRAMFDPAFEEAMFADQPLPSRANVLAIFSRLCSASEMRIGAHSMEKLYDLMVMTFKYQMCACKQVACKG